MHRQMLSRCCLAGLIMLTVAVMEGDTKQMGMGPPPPPTNAVIWDTGSPVVAKGTITGSGTYTQAPGWQPMGQAVLYAVPTAGGPFSTAAGAIVPAMGGPPNGAWGPATINKLATGQYTVYAVIVFNGPGGQQSTVSSPTSIVNVP